MTDIGPGSLAVYTAENHVALVMLTLPGCGKSLACSDEVAAFEAAAEAHGNDFPDFFR